MWGRLLSWLSSANAPPSVCKQAWVGLTLPMTQYKSLAALGLCYMSKPPVVQFHAYTIKLVLVTNMDIDCILYLYKQMREFGNKIRWFAHSCFKML